MDSPEQDGEQHHRGERLDRSGPVHADQFVQPAPLEHGDNHAVGRADRQQVHQRGLDRDENGPEHDKQQQERQADHDRHEHREPSAEDVAQVVVDRSDAADVHLETRAAQRGRHDLVTQPVDELLTVSTDWGAVAGTTNKTAVSPVWFGIGGAASTTPGVC